jgi:hypothetical protein
LLWYGVDGVVANLVADWSGTDFVDGVHISDHGDYVSVSVSIVAVARVSH